jgi:putative tricarboxylic transport membrane protein
VGALGDLANGFSVALTPENLFWALVGVTLGTFIGVLPGIGPAMTVALLLPVTYSLEPISAFIMFAGIYYGGMYGGSTTSILLNTPGGERQRWPPRRLGHSWPERWRRSR